MHPSLQFERVRDGTIYSVRVGLHYRALWVATDVGVHRFWIGSHADYDKLLDR